jgi:Ni/Fe-hydrogenase 1 B-type cytochrome subunit
MIILILSGFQIYYPSSFNVFGTTDMARFLHFIFMYLVMWTLVFDIYYKLVTGEVKEIIFRPRDIKELPALARYYLSDMFKGRPKKDWGKFNPGQRLTYTLWPILLIIQALTGLAMYWPQSGLGVWITEFCNGMLYVKVIHVVLAWIFVVMIAVHLYLGTTGATLLDYYRSMFTGYERKP